MVFDMQYRCRLNRICDSFYETGKLRQCQFKFRRVRIGNVSVNKSEGKLFRGTYSFENDRFSCYICTTSNLRYKLNIIILYMIDCFSGTVSNIIRLLHYLERIIGKI